MEEYDYSSLQANVEEKAIKWTVILEELTSI